jgi:hypothetical protein
MSEDEIIEQLAKDQANDAAFLSTLSGLPYQVIAATLKNWKRECIKKYHEDRGSSHEANVAVNDVIGTLEAAFKNLGVEF